MVYPNDNPYVDEWTGYEYETDENGIVNNLKPNENNMDINQFDNVAKETQPLFNWTSANKVNEKAIISFLGDSVLDCDSYTKSKKNTVDYVLELISGGKKKKNLVNDQSIDGYTVHNVLANCDKANAKSEYIVISAGGNDLLQNALPLLAKDLEVNDLLGLLNRELDKNIKAYRTVIGNLRKQGRKFLLIGLYDGNIAYDFNTYQGIDNACETVISMWNDRLFRLASEFDYVDVLETRNIFDETCYYNDIEPNDRGAKRLAKQIHQWLVNNDAFRVRDNV